MSNTRNLERENEPHSLEDNAYLCAGCNVTWPSTMHKEFVSHCYNDCSGIRTIPVKPMNYVSWKNTKAKKSDPTPGVLYSTQKKPFEIFFEEENNISPILQLTNNTRIKKYIYIVETKLGIKPMKGFFPEKYFDTSSGKEMYRFFKSIGLYSEDVCKNNQGNDYYSLLKYILGKIKKYRSDMREYRGQGIWFLGKGSFAIRIQDLNVGSMNAARVKSKWSIDEDGKIIVKSIIEPIYEFLLKQAKKKHQSCYEAVKQIISEGILYRDLMKGISKMFDVDNNDLGEYLDGYDMHMMDD